MSTAKPDQTYHWLSIALLVTVNFTGAFIAETMPTPSAISSAALASNFTAQADQNTATADTYLSLLHPDRQVVDDSIRRISQSWHSGSAAMMVESARFASDRLTFSKILALTEAKTGQRFGADLDQWYQWIWKQKYAPHPEYAQFKSRLYSRIDTRFDEYFRTTKDAKIRLDEIRWGGVIRDGIPPLKNPKMINATKAGYLADSDVVFGVELGGDARCYPKRILAWHEMFKDTIGGESVCGVY